MYPGVVKADFQQFVIMGERESQKNGLTLLFLRSAILLSHQQKLL